MRLPRIVILLLCLSTCLLTGCPVPKDSPNPDGIRDCPSNCTCEDTGDVFEVICDGGGEEVLLQ